MAKRTPWEREQAKLQKWKAFYSEKNRELLRRKRQLEAELDPARAEARRKDLQARAEKWWNRKKETDPEYIRKLNREKKRRYRARLRAEDPERLLALGREQQRRHRARTKNPVSGDQQPET